MSAFPQSAPVYLLAAVLASAACWQPAQAQSLPAPPVSPAPVINYEYDPQGNPTRVIQAPGVAGFNLSTTTTYDLLNRPAATTDAKAGLTQFSYDGLDRPTQVSDPRRLLTRMPRTGLGDITQQVSPDTGTTAYTYDAAGNLKTRTDSRGVLSTYRYDALNRLNTVVHSQAGQPSQTYSWTYDQSSPSYSNGIGRLTSTGYPAGSSQFSYDPQGRLLLSTQRIAAAAGANAAEIAHTVSYRYNSAGRLTTLIYPSGRMLILGYNGSQVASLSLAPDSSTRATNLLNQIQYAPFGGPQRWLWQMASGTQAWEQVLDLSQRVVRYPLGRFVRDISYDAGDRITSYSHRDATTGTATAAAAALDQRFGYDALSRLSGITAANTSWAISYDANGNRTGVTMDARTSAYTTAATSNRLLSTDSPARSFGYDAAGNTLSDTGAAYSASYDLAGRLATLSKAGVSTSYSYNNQGQRIRKVSSTGANSAVLFVYDEDGQLLGEYDSRGSALREYVWLGARPVAMFMPHPTVRGAAPLVFYIHADHLNAPRVVLDRDNNVRWRWLAEPFGTTAPETDPSGLGSLTQNLRLPGQYADQESGLFYNWFRSYDSTVGRYAQSDPIGLQGGINTYAYVGGNPVSYVDPMGLNAMAGARLGATGGFAIGGPPGGLIGAGLGALGGYLIADALSNLKFNAPPRGLPPDGIDPPSDGQCKPGPASRPSERGKGGQSLWDPKGGEWRWFPGDKWHNPHWDHNSHSGPSSPWVNVPHGGLPPVKP